MTERDYIGPDPVKWVDRLLEVNRGSRFDDHDKSEIDEALRRLRTRLALAALARLDADCL